MDTSNIHIPLAEQLRPKTLEEYIGQTHLMGKDAVLYKAIASGHIPSMILWGPPGVGKTTLAFLISLRLQRPFYTLSAINAGVKDVREVLQLAQTQEGAILFIDEIHRFNKSQQDSLLNAIEKGIITFIGATTENPSFEVITPLLSRCQTYILKNLEESDLLLIVEHAIKHLENQLQREIKLTQTQALLRISGGDARKLLNAIEIVVHNLQKEACIEFTDANVMAIIQQNLATYDKNGETHYDIISAFIKSIRGSDPNAAVYWLARMLAGGEDVKFIARRLVILASEDIGNANPNALLLANACFDTVHKIGYPECRITLSQTAIYLACSAKSNASYTAIDAALDIVRQEGDLAVPLHLRNAPTKFMKDLGYGKEYQYAHAHENNFVLQEFLPEKIKNTVFYEPQNNAKEKELRAGLKARWGTKYKY
ncbi:MAG: replication-associated recombination protein A [Bacteroidales bacterium]